jgi:hypothetical protein
MTDVARHKDGFSFVLQGVITKIVEDEGKQRNTDRRQ